MKTREKATAWEKWRLQTVWWFPAVLILILIILTSFKISGSSVGVYYQLLYGKRHDPALIAGQPRSIRSDEWGINTPFDLSQTHDDYAVTNPTVGGGENISTVIDAPYKSWSTLFKPQNLAFFIMPVAYAFAFKWWLMGVLLMLGCYTFLLTLLPRKYLLAALISIAVFFSPFVQWWYESATLLPLAYGLFMAAIFIRLLRPYHSWRQHILLATGLTYVLSCFAFILYVPFLFSIAITLTCLGLGYIINLWKIGKTPKQLFDSLIWIAVPLVIAIILTGLFLMDNHSVITALSNSIYPGHRIETSGQMSLRQFFDGYYNMQLQDDTKAAHFNLNQSEASNFIYLFPFLIPALAYMLRQRKKATNSLDWRIIGLFLAMAIFLMRLFIPQSEFIANLTQLNRIPQNRLLIGIGLLDIFSLGIVLEYLLKPKFQLPRIFVSTSALLSVIVVGLTGISLKMSFDGYLESVPKIVLISLLVGFIVWLLLARHFTTALILFALYAILSTIHVNPLYRGLGILADSRLTSTMSRIGDKDGKWVVGDNAASFESFPSALGLNTISGVYAYPQLGIWENIAKDPASKAVYNRYAHVFFSVGTLSKKPLGEGAYFDPPALDAFRVHVDSCSAFLQQQDVHYVLMTDPLVGGCAKQIATVKYPLVTFRIYRISALN